MRPALLILLVLVVAAVATTTTTHPHFKQTRYARDTTLKRTNTAPVREYVISDGREWDDAHINNTVIARLPLTAPGCRVFDVTQTPVRTLIALECTSAVDVPEAELILDSTTATVELIGKFTILGTITPSDAGSETNAGWNLVRISEQTPVYTSGTYSFRDTGSSTFPIYWLDTGVLQTHDEFGGRVSCGTNTIDGTGCEDTCAHGTFTGSLLLGVTLGVAKTAVGIQVKVLDDACEGNSYTVAAGLAWVQTQCMATPNIPIVVSMSLGGTQSSTVDDAVTALQNSCHVSISVAAGNQAANACNYSPADVSTCMTVAASTPSDALAYYSNTGSCVDFRAPGGDGGSNPVTGAGCAFVYYYASYFFLSGTGAAAAAVSTGQSSVTIVMVNEPGNVLVNGAGVSGVSPYAR